MERLQQAGYRTGATGKIHMMPHKGFHYERLIGGKGSRWTQFEDQKEGRGPLGPTYASWLERQNPGAYESIYEQRREEYGDGFKTYTNVLPKEQYVDYWIADQAIEFLHDPHSDPFLLWCGFDAPHGPQDPPEPYDELYTPEDVPRPRQREDVPDSASPKGNPTPDWDEDIREWIAYSWAQITFVDDMIERLLETLEERDLLDDTMIIFTSDHGNMAGDYNMIGLGELYEEVVHVPLIVVPPEDTDRDRYGGLVEMSDVAPTVLDYAGIDVPDLMPTRSLRPILEGERDDHRESVLCEYTTNDQSRRSMSIRTDRYKYIVHNTDQESEFYDLKDDPGELRNVVDDPAYREEIARLRELLVQRLMNAQQSYYRDRTPLDRDLQTWLY